MFGIAPLRLYAYAAIALAALGAFIYVKHLQHVAAQVPVLKRQIRQIVDANASMADTLETYKRANEKWQKTCTPAETYLKLQEEQIRREEQIANLIKQNLALRNKDRELPQCVALLRMSLSQRCPNITAGLLKLAGSTDSVRTGSSPGGEADPR